LVIDVLTIKLFGILAVACANLISAFFVFIVTYLFSQKYYKIQYNLMPIIFVCLICIVLLVPAYRFLGEISFFSILCKIGLMLLIGSLPFIFRIVNISNIKMIIHFRKT
jgi:hypothetical protein